MMGRLRKYSQNNDWLLTLQFLLLKGVWPSAFTMDTLKSAVDVLIPAFQFLSLVLDVWERAALFWE